MSILEKLKAGFRQGSEETDQEILEKHLREREKRRDLMESQRNPSKVAYAAGRTYRSLRPAGRAISRAGGIIYRGAKKLDDYGNRPHVKRQVRRLNRAGQNLSSGFSRMGPITDTSGNKLEFKGFEIGMGDYIYPKKRTRKRRSR